MPGRGALLVDELEKAGALGALRAGQPHAVKLDQAIATVRAEEAER
jgi:hypothetical protein